MALLPYNPYRRQLTVMACATWMVFLGILLMIVPPAFVKDVAWRSSYLPFFILAFLGLFLSIWAVTGRWKRSSLWAGIVTVGLWLRVNQLDAPWNILLLVSFGCVWEYYWHLSLRPAQSDEVKQAV